MKAGREPVPSAGSAGGTGPASQGAPTAVPTAAAVPPAGSEPAGAPPAGGAPPAAAPFGETFYDRPVLAVARDLLGATIRHGPVALRVTEVEAYGGTDDPASHAHRGPTTRSQVMFGPPGRAYVYFVYGMHWCFNVVCSAEGTAAAVLVRAGAVLAGLDEVRARRPGGSEAELARGPGRFARALGVDGTFTGTPLSGGGPVTVEPGEPRWPMRLVHADPTCGRGVADTASTDPLDPLPAPSDPLLAPKPLLVHSGPRIGISRATDLPYRMWLAGEPSVSRGRPGARPRRRPGSNR